MTSEEFEPPQSAPSGSRSGPGYWCGSYLHMVHWQLATLRRHLPALAITQLLAGVGLVLGLGLFFSGPVPAQSVLYISTGVPVINLYMLGLVMLPQMVGYQRLAQTYDFVQSLPIPRSVDFAAWYTVTILTGAPAMVATLVAARLRYGVDLAVSPMVVVATALVCLASTAIGYAMGHAIAVPMLAMLLTQIFNFFVIGFAPVAIPPEQLPRWLTSANQWLPFESMGVVMRSSLVDSPVIDVGRAYLVLGVWTCGCLGVAAWAVGRRG
jgi:ABC-2 type transport system permease protein